MFEAVNSVLSNASLVRASVEQLSSARANVAQAESIELPEVPYISPYISLDLNYDKAVIQIRDSSTGDVLNQFPSRETLAARAAQAQRQAEVKKDSKVKHDIHNTKGAASSVQKHANAHSIEHAQSSQGASSASAPSPAVSAAQAQVAVDALSTAAQSGVSQTTFATQA